jgi:hypothetical protein
MQPNMKKVGVGEGALLTAAPTPNTPAEIRFSGIKYSKERNICLKMQNDHSLPK